MSDEPENQNPAPEESGDGGNANEPQEELTPSPAKADAFGTLPAIGQGKLSESDDRTFGMLAHLLGAFTFLVGPLIIWLIKKDDSPFVDDQGKEAINWQICVAIAGVGCAILSQMPVVGCFVGMVSLAIPVVNLIFCILACVEANKGVAYRYPFNIRLIS